MELTDRDTLVKILKNYKIFLKKSLGQNFLVNKKIIEKIVEAGNVTKSDVVLEIGAGIGTLTRELAKYVYKVIAVEIDKRFEEILKESLKEFSNVELIFDDILKIELSKIVTTPYKIFGNLPYYISGTFLGEYLKKGPYAQTMVLLLQKEMVERITSKHGTKNFSPLSILLSLMYDFEIITPVPAHFFFPIPEVDSLLVKFSYNPKNQSIKNPELFYKLIKSAFKFRRKYLINNLKSEFRNIPWEDIFSKLNINLKERAENIPIDVYIKISNLMEEYGI